ncbi:hypothetical protein C0989_012433 [Termitomyces sp. Mn162]|nr:hypothetical protein C0989_012433 [Termitomyces sp. Mn162]
MDHSAEKEQRETELGEPPAARAKIAVRRRVTLNDILGQIRSMELTLVRKERIYLRPQTSDPTPQKIAPTRRPIFWLSLRNGPLKPNSFTTGARIKPVTTGQRLSLDSPD